MYATFFTAQSQVSTTNVLGVGQFDLDIESGDSEVIVRPAAVSDLNSQTAFELYVNDRRLLTWDGTDPVEIRCLYPGDYVTVVARNDESTAVVDEHAFGKITDCDDFNSFPEKFRYAKVQTGDGSFQPYAVNDRYAFGLAIDPNGPNVATDYNGGHDVDVPRISLANEWHYVEQYTRPVAGFEPPVFVAVMVDNVHWTDVPDPSHPAVPAGTYFDWDDEPPYAVGADAFEIDADGTVTPTPAGSEPTNDVYLAFKPGCEESQFRFVAETAGYANEIYLDDEKIIDDTNAMTDGAVYTAPGVECRGDADWD